MSREDALAFLRVYATDDVDVLTQLVKSGRIIATCTCEEDGCQGIAMMYPDDWDIPPGSIPVADLAGDFLRAIP